MYTDHPSLSDVTFHYLSILLVASECNEKKKLRLGHTIVTPHMIIISKRAYEPITTYRTKRHIPTAKGFWPHKSLWFIIDRIYATTFLYTLPCRHITCHLPSTLRYSLSYNMMLYPFWSYSSQWQAHLTSRHNTTSPTPNVDTSLIPEFSSPKFHFIVVCFVYKGAGTSGSALQGPFVPSHYELARFFAIILLFANRFCRTDFITQCPLFKRDRSGTQRCGN